MVSDRELADVWSFGHLRALLQVYFSGSESHFVALAFIICALPYQFPRLRLDLQYTACLQCGLTHFITKSGTAGALVRVLYFSDITNELICRLGSSYKYTAMHGPLTFRDVLLVLGPL